MTNFSACTLFFFQDENYLDIPKDLVHNKLPHIRQMIKMKMKMKINQNFKKMNKKLFSKKRNFSRSRN
jgi:hypothetical protein